MGTVYLAESESGERPAVKMINPDLADDETFRERFGVRSSPRAAYAASVKRRCWTRSSTASRCSS